MDSADHAPPNLSHKPLALLGRDEMNLAEFPIALLTDRVPKDQREAIYRDEIRDERSGLILTRQLTITAGNHGLTTALDDEVILSLIQLTKEKNNFTGRRVEFSRHELVQLLGWSIGGASYERIATSLDRWTSVYLKYENAWRDNRTKSWKSAGFHIIERFELNDNRSTADQFDLIPSFIVWNEVIFESFQAGYLKPLDYDLCLGLGNSTAKRLYRFLDKRFHHKADWTFGLKELAHEHIGLGRHYDGPAHLRRKLGPAIGELERVNFLEPLGDSERYWKEGRDWKIRLSRRPGVAASPASAVAAPSGDPDVVAELVGRGVTRATARDLAVRFAAGVIAAKIEVFDWLSGKRDRRVSKSPAGYLVRSIVDDYAEPSGFVSRAERQRRADAGRAQEREASEARRRAREREARDEADRRAVAAYWDSLTPAGRAELDAAALAGATAEELELIEGPLKRHGLTLIRHEQILGRLRASGMLPPAET